MLQVNNFEELCTSIKNRCPKVKEIVLCTKNDPRPKKKRKEDDKGNRIEDLNGKKEALEGKY